MVYESVPRPQANLSRGRMRRFVCQVLHGLDSVKTRVLTCINVHYWRDEITENGYSQCVMNHGRKEVEFLQRMDKIAENSKIVVAQSKTEDDLSIRSFEDNSDTQKVKVIPRQTSLPVLHRIESDQFSKIKFHTFLLIKRGTFGNVFVNQTSNASKKFVLKAYQHPLCHKRTFSYEVKHENLDTLIRSHNFLFYHNCFFSIRYETVASVLRKNNHIGFPQQHVWFITKQLLEAISYLHQKSITHTQIDPEHIFFVDPTQLTFDYNEKLYYMVKNPYVKLEMTVNAVVGTAPRHYTISHLFYRAPEVQCHRFWSFPVDIWAAGCVIFEMYAGVRLGLNHKYTSFRLINRCVGLPSAEVIMWLERSEINDYLTKSMSEALVAHEMNYNVQKAIMHFDALDHHQPFGSFLRQMINLDPRDRLPVSLLINHAYLQSPNIHIYENFFAL